MTGNAIHTAVIAICATVYAVALAFVAGGADPGDK